jgi:dTDP-glucose pyrophosphorylase
MTRLEAVIAETTVLIPAAGRVGEGVLSLSNVGCTAQIPVAGRPVIYWTLTYLRKLGFRRFIMAVPKRGLFVEDLVECMAGSDCEFSFVASEKADGKLGDTVGLLLRQTATRSALIVLGDTYFQFADSSILAGGQPLVLTAPVVESYRWCIAETLPDGRVARFRDKVPGLQDRLEALIGVYFFPDVELPRRLIEEAERRTDRVDFTTVLEGVREQSMLRAYPAGTWQDVGHPDRQAGSAAALLQKRAFNDLNVDPVLSTITKRSRMKAKFVDEINYFRLLPRDLAVLFPRVLDFSIDWNDPYLTMEYYGYSTLAEVFLYENVDPGMWENVFRHLFAIMTGPFARYARPLDAEVVRGFYLNKTRDRLALLTGGKLLSAMKDGSATPRINGKSYRSLETLWPRIEQDVTRLAASTQGAIIHGDLCLSNILYDLRAQVCKLIDPRGSFGPAGIFGDPRYDVAKLYHSVYGLYDFITNDLFQIRESAEELTVDIRRRGNHRQILERFERVFFPHYDRREILLITGLIFAGIPSLHYDKPDRQLAMLARALEIFGELYPEPQETMAHAVVHRS